MSEINHDAVKQTLADQVETRKSEEPLKSSEELAELDIARNVQGLRHLLVAGKEVDGSDETAEEVEAEKAALQAAIKETAEAHKEEGVTETMIMMWITQEELGSQLSELEKIEGLEDLENLDRGAFREVILQNPEAAKIIQRIGVGLGLDLGKTTDAADGDEAIEGVDGKYGKLTRGAVIEVQTALKNMGYPIGEYGVDGAAGKDTLRALALYAKGVAPEDVVEAAVEEAEEGPVEAAVAEVETPIAVAEAGPVVADDDGGGAAAIVSAPGELVRDGDPVLPGGDEGDDLGDVAGRRADIKPASELLEASQLQQRADTLIDDLGFADYIEYANGEFTHKLGLTTQVDDILKVNVGHDDVNREQSSQALQDFNQRALEHFAETNNISLGRYNGLPAFYVGEVNGMGQGPGKPLLLKDVLEADDLVRFVNDWKAENEDAIEEEDEGALREEVIPVRELQPLLQRVLTIDGVQEIEANGDGYTVVLFDGTEVSLYEVYRDMNEGRSTMYSPSVSLDNAISQAGERLAEKHGLDFSPEIRDPGLKPAQFLKDGKFVFRLSELAKQDLDDNLNFAGAAHAERAGIFSEVLDDLPTKS